jgi:integrase
MQVDWIDLKNCMVHVPGSAAVKNDMDWDVPFLEETGDYLRLWIEERECFEKYEDSALVWLTKYGNPYGSRSVNHHWRKLRDAAGIEVGGRYLPYYSIRHTQGTNMGEQIGDAGAAAQLRQKDQRSAKKYQHARMQQQVDALNNSR